MIIMMFLPDVVLFYSSGILSFENKTNEEEHGSCLVYRPKISFRRSI